MTTERRSRRLALGAGLIAVTAVSVGSSAVPGRAAAKFSPSVTPVSLVSFAPSNSPWPSGNGRFVVFVSAPGTADGRNSSVWLSNRETGSLTELTLPKDGIRLGDSVNPVISTDGCTVVVTTEMAFDLFRDDDHGMRWDVYRTTPPDCGGKSNDWTLVSTHLTADGLAQARGDVDPSVPASVSSSGSVIAYVRPFESLSGIEDAAYLPSAIDVVDLTLPVDDPAHVTPAPGLPTEAAGTPIKYVGETSPSLSADGTMMVFASDATSTDAVPDWVLPAAPGAAIPTQIYLWNRNDGDPFTAVSTVSVGDAGPANASATSPVVSADGRIVAFSSGATNLVANDSLAACGTPCAAQIYVVDRDVDGNLIFDEEGSRTLKIVSAVRSADDQPFIAGNGNSFAPTISGDGTTIAFTTKASNLMTVQPQGGGGGDDGDLLVAELSRGGLRRVFDSPEPVPAAHSHPHLSANGRLLVADSLVADRLIGNPAVIGRNVVAASFAPSLSIADIDLGTVMVGVPGPEWYVNVVNQGPGAFLPVIVASDKPKEFTINGGSCFDQAPVPAGGSCDVKLLLIPVAAGPRKATLTVSEAGYGAITLTAPIRGAGGEPALDAFPSAGDLGSSVVGQRSPTPVTFDVSNIGIVPAGVASIKVTGANPEDFAVTTNGCKVVLNYSDKCQVEVSFVPTASGRRTASVNFATALGQYTSVLISGEGYYVASLVAAPSGRPGQRIGIAGQGFPARSAVVVGWSDGSGTPMTVLTSDDGSFITNYRIRQGAQPGAKVLVAQVPAGPSASTIVDIERVRDRRRG